MSRGLVLPFLLSLSLQSLVNCGPVAGSVKAATALQGSPLDGETMKDLAQIAPGPVIPGNAETILKGIVDQLSAIDGATGGDSDKVESLSKQAAANLQDSLMDEEALKDLAQTAFAKVHLRVLKQLFTGGCPRNFAGCPLNWNLDSATSTCQPPADYDGHCGPFDSSIDVHEKESLAWKCRLGFPCANACSKDFSSCPDGWTSLDGLCMAPSGYTGMCSPAMDFATYSTAPKSRWAALCDAPFPCMGKATESKTVLLSGRSTLNTNAPDSVVVNVVIEPPN